jgi:ubiquinone/menaquinone biosynthesis C-methylase UbiE
MNDDKPRRSADYGLPLYFDLQAKMGHTKHLGGVAATRKLVELCRLGPGKTLLYVGSGGGNSALYIAENYGCRVTGVDLLPGMVESARKWAAEKGLEGQVEFRVGDAQNLPFEADQFDVVMCESVNVFVPDKAKAMSEYARVVRPGGFVGLNEAIWVNDPTENVRKIIVEATGQQFEPSATWQKLLTEAGLIDVTASDHKMAMGQEARNQSKLLSFRTYLRILGRTIKVLLTDRETRALLKYMSSSPRQYFDYLGYGLYVGRKP